MLELSLHAWKWKRSMNMIHNRASNALSSLLLSSPVLCSSALSGGRCYDGGVVSNQSPALHDSVPACSALLAGKRPLSFTLEICIVTTNTHIHTCNMLIVFSGNYTDRAGNSGAQDGRSVQGLPHHSLSGAEQDILEAEGEVHHQTYGNEKDGRKRPHG